MKFTREEFSNKYENFCDLLSTFLMATYEPNQSDEETIVEFIKERTTEQVTETIKQAKEILEFEEFPYELIGDISNRALSYMQGSEPEKYYNWVKWMIEELPKEAKKQEKL